MKWIIAQILGNLGYVGDGIWRSAQRWYLYPIFLCLRLKTIINLAGYPNRDRQDRFERWFCWKFRIHYVTFDTIGPYYRFDEVFKILSICERPVLVHCEGGKDRTGGLIAYYKRQVMEKTWGEIIKDWKIYGIPWEDWLMFLFTKKKS